jgi:hypothetical protein
MLRLDRIISEGKRKTGTRQSVEGAHVKIPAGRVDETRRLPEG